MTGRRGWIVAGLLLVALACRGDGTPAGGLAAKEAALQGAIVIVLDTVRPDRLSAMGHDRPTSPGLARLAERGVLFEQVVAYSSWTLPSMAALLSGTSAGVSLDGEFLLTRSLVSAIREAGFRTAAITEGGFVSSVFGLERGFDDWVEEEGAVRLGGPAMGEGSGGIENTFRLAREWIDEHGDERFVLFLHTYEPHTPYRRHHFTSEMDPGATGGSFEVTLLPRIQHGELALSDDDIDYVKALYDGGILESDRQVESFLGHLETAGLRDRTLVVVTSDHGEELGEHYRRAVGDHGHSMLDDLLLVPLIIDDPLVSYPVRRVGAQVRNMDILPTVAERLGVALPADLDGVSLLPLMRGEETRGRIAFGSLTQRGPSRSFVRHLDFKWIRIFGPGRGIPLQPSPPELQFYDLSVDPGERHNLAASRPDLVRRFGELWTSMGRDAEARKRFELPETIEDVAIERLRSLGYVE